MRSVRHANNVGARLPEPRLELHGLFEDRLLGAGAVPGDLVLLDDNATGTGISDPAVRASPSRKPRKDRVPGAVGSHSAARVDAAGGTNEPSGVGDGVVSSPAAATVGGPSRSTAKAVTVLTPEAMDDFASQGITARDLLRRVVLPLAGTSVQYPHHEVRFATHVSYVHRMWRDTFSVCANASFF